jgi:hypothetical protein
MAVSPFDGAVFWFSPSSALEQAVSIMDAIANPNTDFNTFFFIILLF